MSNNVNFSSLFLYSAIALPLAFASIPIYIHAPDFYATEYDISLSTLGIVLFLIRAIDAVQDPLIGFFSDKFQSYKNHIISFATILLAISFYFLFNPLFNPIIWFAVTLFLATFAYSLIAINLNSFVSTWSKNEDDKTKIVGFRETFGIIGLILAISLPNIFQSVFDFDKQTSFQLLSLILMLFSLLALPSFLIWFRNRKSNSLEGNSSQKKQFFSTIKKLPTNLKRFYLIYLISVLASSIPAALILFYIRDFLKLESYTGLFLLSYFASAIMGILIWKAVSKKSSKKISWLTSMVFSLTVFSAVFLLEEGDLTGFLIICILSGIAFGSDLVMPHSILADEIQAENKESDSSLFYSLLAFLMKFAYALAVAIALPILEFTGFEADKENSEQSLTVLVLIYALLPCLIKIISSILLWRNINENKNFNPNRSVSNVI